MVSKGDTPMGSVHRFIGDRVMLCTVEQVMGVLVLQRGLYGELCVFASKICKYDLWKEDLFVISRARVRRMCLGFLQ